MHQPVILQENSDWIAVNKPAGWLSIPGRPSKDYKSAPELLKWLSEHVPVDQVRVVHRLDRETSGVLLFAKTAEFHRTASLWFQERKVKKFYHCLASGRPWKPVLRIHEPVEGKDSLSQVEVLERYDEHAFLGRVRIFTGRRHQIRVHLAGQGYPLLGDQTYGGKSQLELTQTDSLFVERVALHASRLELPTGEVFEAEWPEDFSGWVKLLRDFNQGNS